MEEAKAGDLPEDIVFDVLSRVPAKALCRFRCVCKAWHVLISDPTFVARQRSLAGPHLVGVHFGYRISPPEVRVFDMDGNVVKELEVRLPLGKDDDGSVLQQATSTTRRLDLICALREPRATCHVDAVIIDPAAGRARAIMIADTRFTALSSIGRAAISGAFKIICLQGSFPCCICNVATIMLTGGAERLTWRRRSSPPFDFSYQSEKRATVNGIVYFIADFNKHDAGSNWVVDRIAAFDLESEEWNMINGPTFVIQEKIWYVTLTELKGCLGVVQFLGHRQLRREPYDDDYYAIIWLLVDPNKNVWVKDCSIQMPKTWISTKQLWALDDGRILLLVTEFLKKVITKENKTTIWYKEILVFYNPSTKAFRKFRDDVPLGFYHKLVYGGSLLS